MQTSSNSEMATSSHSPRPVHRGRSFFIAALGLTVGLAHAAEPEAAAGSEASAEFEFDEAILKGSEAAAPLEEGYWAERSSVSGFREADVLTTPFSVSSFPAEVIRDQQARSLTDVVKNDPSVTPAGSPEWYDRVLVRGFYLSVDAIYRDGLSINDQGSIALENKAAVEVNKGLSALRYGATSPGGVINYVVKRPTEEPLARLEVFGDDDGSLGAHADYGRRFGEENQYGVRINAAKKDIQNHWDNFEHDTAFFSTFFDWRLTDNLEISLDFEHQSKTETEFASPSVWWFDSVAEARAFFPKLNPETAVVPGWNTVPNDQNYYGAQVNYRLAEDWRLKYAYQRAELDRAQFGNRVYSLEPDGTYDAWLYYSPDQARNHTAHQLVMEGEVEALGMRHALAGGYDDVRRDMTFPDATWVDLGTGNLHEGGNDLARPGPSALTAPASLLRSRVDQRSVFLTDTITVNEWFEIFAGLRHTMIEQYGRDNSSAPLEKTYDESSTNPTLGLIYKPREKMAAYASYSEGIEIGGTAPDTAVNAFEVMAPLESSQIELGFKYELNDRALLTVALFEIDKGLEYTDDANVFVQNGRQVHQGAEVVFRGRVTDELRLIGGAAFLDAEVEKTGDPSLEGKRPTGVPEWQANLYVEYDLSLLLPGLFINGGIFYVGERAILPDNTWEAGDYIRLDAGLRYEHRLFGDRKVTYRLNVENLTDEEYLQNTAFRALNFGAPLTVLASVQIDL